MRLIRNRTHSYFIGGDSFKKEFISQLKFLVIVTLGFTIAFTWRQTIFDTTQWAVQAITHIQNSAGLSFITSISITIVSLLIIVLTSRYLNHRQY